MDRESAYELLGLDDEADRNRIRRAYLRLVKEYKPESDPKGFQRLREAYELTLALHEVRTESRLATLAAADSSEGPESVGPSDASPAHPAPAPEPDPPELDAETVFAYRALHHPDELTNEELGKLVATRDPSLILQVAESRTRDGKEDPWLVTLVEGALDAESELDPVPLEASVSLVPRLLMALQPDAARRLEGALQSSMWLQGGQAALRPDVMTRFQLMQEYGRLPEDFPAAPGTIILHGLACGDLIEADDRLMEWARDHAETARFAARQLSGLPELQRFFHLSLDVPLASSTAGSMPWGCFGVTIVWLLVNLAARTDSPRRSYSPPPSNVRVESYGNAFRGACGLTRLPSYPVARPCAEVETMIEILESRSCSRLNAQSGLPEKISGLLDEVEDPDWRVSVQAIRDLAEDRLFSAWRRLEEDCGDGGDLPSTKSQRNL